MEAIIKRIGYPWRDVQLLKVALTHPSCTGENNQRLEFLGDAVLQLCVSDMLFREHKHAKEGQLTRLRASLVCEAALLEVAEELHLADHLRTNPPLSPDTRGRTSILADGVEALLASVYLDGGLKAALSVVNRLWGERIGQATARSNEKNRLQELLQAHGKSEPWYEVISSSGPPHQRQFEVAVYDGETELARGAGSSKKLAEQRAAAEALRLLKGKDKI